MAFAADPSKPQGASASSGLVVLGLETSCDETAAAVLRLREDGSAEVLADCVYSQIEEHTPFGGVVPEIAARAHVDALDALIRRALDEAEMGFADLDAVAATSGPGLVGGVMVGLMMAKAISLAADIPLIAVNHLEGHALSPRLTGACPFPYLLLLISGGHTQLLAVDDLTEMTRLGSTIDDAAGEAFDKTAKIMQLGYPGGPAMERAALSGDATRFDLPRPLTRSPNADFSFAGLKTAARRAWDALDNPDEQDRNDLAASVQAAIADCLADRSRKAMAMFIERHPDEAARRFVVAGGVAANKAVKSALEAACADFGFTLSAPPAKWCTDNAVMIALAGAERLKRGEISDLDAPARPRWPLDQRAAADDPASGAGRKGPKA